MAELILARTSLASDSQSQDECEHLSAVVFAEERSFDILMEEIRKPENVDTRCGLVHRILAGINIEDAGISRYYRTPELANYAGKCLFASGKLGRALRMWELAKVLPVPEEVPRYREKLSKCAPGRSEAQLDEDTAEYQASMKLTIQACEKAHRNSVFAAAHRGEPASGGATVVKTLVERARSLELV